MADGKGKAIIKKQQKRKRGITKWKIL